MWYTSDLQESKKETLLASKRDPERTPRLKSKKTEIKTAKFPGTTIIGQFRPTNLEQQTPINKHSRRMNR